MAIRIINSDGQEVPSDARCAIVLQFNEDVKTMDVSLYVDGTRIAYEFPKSLKLIGDIVEHLILEAQRNVD